MRPSPDTTADHDGDAGGADWRRALAYGFVVALLIAPFAVFAIAVATDYAVSSTVVVLGAFAAVWAWCAWLLRRGRAEWLFGTFLIAVVATVVVIATA